MHREKIVPDKVASIECERHVILKSGHYYLTMIHEKKPARRPQVNPKLIRNTSVRNVVQCIRWLRSQQIPVKFCSYQLLLALVAQYLGTQKKPNKIMNHDDCSYRTVMMYDKKVYDLAKAIHFLAIEFAF